MERIGKDTWEQLDELERQTMTLAAAKDKVSRSDIERYTGKSTKTITSRLKELIDDGLISANGNKYDPKRTYKLLIKEESR